MSNNSAFFTFGRQVAFMVAANVTALILGVIQMPVITRHLGTSMYGTWALINIAVSLITPFSMLGFSASIIRFLAAEKDPAKIREDYCSALVLVSLAGSIFSLLLFLCSGLLASYIFKDPSASDFIRLASVLVLLNTVFPIILAYFRTGTKIGTYIFLDLGLHILQISLIIALTTLGYQLTGVIVAAITTLLTLNLTGIVIIGKQIGFKWPKFSNMKKYLKWGVPLTPNSAILWIINASDRYIVGYILGVSAAGIYSAAYGIGAYSSFAVFPVGIVLYPVISRTYDEGRMDDCITYLQYSFKYLMMVAIPAATGLSILAAQILRILTTSEFVGGSSVVPLIAFGAVMTCLYQFGVYVIQLVGKTYVTVRLLTTAAVLNIILNLVLVPRMGIFGSGLAVLISYTLLGGITLAVTRRYLKYDLNWLFILKSVFSSGIMALAIWLMRPHSMATVLASIAAGIAIYFGLLIIMKGFSKSELSLFASYFKRSLNTSAK